MAESIVKDAETTPEVTENVKRTYRLVIKNPKVAEIAVSKFNCGRKEIEEMLADEVRQEEADDYGGWCESYFEDQGLLDGEIMLRNVITGCDEVIILDENDKVLMQYTFEQLMSDEEAEDWTEEIFRDMGINDEEAAFVVVRDAVPYHDIVYKCRSKRPIDINSYYQCLFKAFHIEGLSVEKVDGCSFIWWPEEDALQLEGNEDNHVYVIVGAKPEILWED